MPPVECSARGQSEEGGELPPAGKRAEVLDRGEKRRGGDRADPGNGHQPPRGLVGLGGGFKLPVDRLDCFVERIDLSDERSEGEAHAVGNHDLAVLIDAAVGQFLERVSVRNPLRGDDADLRQMAAQGVERRRALPDHELARAMAHQRRLVLHRAHGNEALARTPCRLANRRRVGWSFLLRRT